MGDNDETHLHAMYASHLDMDEAFCARMRLAIVAGLECPPHLGPEIRLWSPLSPTAATSGTGRFLPPCLVLRSSKF
jgi:hypothetical protein